MNKTCVSLVQQEGNESINLMIGKLKKQH